MEEKDFISIEARLLEQEHRPFYLIKSFLNRKQWDKEDPRRKAVKAALIWRLFFSPTIIAGTGGIIAFASLLVLVWQTNVMIEQNEKINNQTYLIEAQRRSALQFEISEILNRIDEELKRDTISRKLSPQLKSRIVAATISMRPYRSYENDSLSHPYSYEKGQLFVSLLNSNMNLSDLNEILEKSNFSNMIVENVSLGSTNDKLNILNFNFGKSYFREVTFVNIFFGEGCSIQETQFKECTFNSISFGGLYLSKTTFESTIFNIQKIQNLQKDNWIRVDNRNKIRVQGTSFNQCIFSDSNKGDNIILTIYPDRSGGLISNSMISGLNLGVGMYDDSNYGKMRFENAIFLDRRSSENIINNCSLDVVFDEVMVLDHFFNEDEYCDVTIVNDSIKQTVSDFVRKIRERKTKDEEGLIERIYKNRGNLRTYFVYSSK